MKISKDMWDRFQASNSKSRRKSRALQAIAHHVYETRAERAARRGGDVLGKISPARKLAVLRTIENSQNRKKLKDEIRSTLLAAARVARSAGFRVQSSKSVDGSVSSYYAVRNGCKVRISDHILPATAKREAQADFHGGRSPFVGEIIIDRAMSATRIKRLLLLAEAGRI